MNNNTVQEWILTTGIGQKIVHVEISNDRHSIKYYTIPELKTEKAQMEGNSQEFEEMFPIVDIEGLSLEESFMQYEPQTSDGKRVKASIIKAKEIGMKNFRIPAMDPAFDDDGETIIYCAGRKPAVGKSAKWWEENAPKFMPSKNSRLKDDLQADVVLGVMRIKYLVEEKGYQVAEAWKAVCVDSKDLGHYRNLKNAKHDFETTGSRQIGKCFDLGNTCKIVKKREASGLVLFGGSFNVDSNSYPLADADCIRNPDVDRNCSVGELVLDV